MASRYTGLIDRYRDRLPIANETPAVALGEGGTPLIRLDNLARDIGFDGDLYVKYEGLNPSGSFKDRGMTMAVTSAVADGVDTIICASTGNTSASAAAYAARAGLTAFVLIPDGKIATGKLAQAMIQGARIVQIRGNFDDGMRLVKQVAETAPVTLVNSVNPFRLQGQKTAAFEICDELGRVPDYHALPVGNAGNISAHWLGYKELAAQPGTLTAGDCNDHSYSIGGYDKRPTMLGFQSTGAAPFLRGAAVDEPDTVATAIRIGHPQSWNAAWAAHDESGGHFDELPDSEILHAQKQLAAREGIFCEPASAASIAGVMRAIEKGRIEAGSTVVCTLTGHGLKDPDRAIEQGGGLAEIETLDATEAAVRKRIESGL
ncbi:threonine synthase [Salinisphaera sp. USBA-960]|nr:threonine synthase [Salifodinibacter halophilus]NNC26372.1 threonine synthase [Salifodinibacter halophilus]